MIILDNVKRLISKRIKARDMRGNSTTTKIDWEGRVRGTSVATCDDSTDSTDIAEEFRVMIDSALSHIDITASKKITIDIRAIINNDTEVNHEK